MELYLSLRTIHVACASITGVGFLVRGIWMLRGSPRLEHRLTRTLPHINDSILLAAAIGMLWVAQVDPLDHAWLMAKMTALVLYVVLGSVALRRGKTAKIRALAFALALLSFGYIFSVAVTRNPLPCVYYLYPVSPYFARS